MATELLMVALSERACASKQRSQNGKRLDTVSGALMPAFPKCLSHWKNIKAWLIWRYTPNAKNAEKLDKVPFQARFPERKASNRKSAHWSTFAVALATYKEGRADGVGFVVSEAEETEVDFDDCRNPDTGELSDGVQRLLKMGWSYCEVTPSKGGIRLIGTVTGQLADRSIHQAFALPDGTKGEIYKRAKRYITVTGDRLPEAPDALNDISETVSAILAQDVASSRNKFDDDAISDDPFEAVDTRGQLNFSTDQIRFYMRRLPPADAKHHETNLDMWGYTTFMNVVFAVHDETRGSEDGFELLREWAATTPHYDEDGLRAKWDSARGSNTGENRISFRFILKMGNDWTRPEREKTLDELIGKITRAVNRNELEDLKIEAQALQIDSAMHRTVLAATYRTAFRRITGAPISEALAKRELAYRDPDAGNMPTWMKPFCFVSSVKKFFDTKTGDYYDVEAFDLAFGRRFMTPEEIAQELVRPTVKPSDAAMHLYQVPVVAHVGYMPFKDRPASDLDGEDDIERPLIYTLRGVRYVNRFNMRGAVAPIPTSDWTNQTRADVKAILALILRVTGTKRERDLLLSVWRYILVERKRVPFAIAAMGAEKSGKTTVFVLIAQALFGAENVGIYGPQVLLDRSDGSWQEGHLWKVIEELYLPEHVRSAVIERMKPCVTNGEVAARFMYQGTRTVPNTAVYCALTNYSDMLALTGKDTRFLPFMPHETATAAAVEKLIREDPEFYRRAHVAMGRSLGAFRWWLEKVFKYHAEFDPVASRAPASEIKSQIIEEVRTGLEQDIHDLIDEAPHPLVCREIICLKSLLSVMAERNVRVGDENRKRQAETVAAALKRLDFRPRGQMRLSFSLNSELTDPGGPAADSAPRDNRTSIYTSGDGPFDSGALTADRIGAWVASGGL